jgi:phosphopantothenoylcysteine decarboxylase/phosphopantothenate--cysteine ligase
MASGRADDLATAMLLASDKPVLIAPAMNHRMWTHPATVANVATLDSRGMLRVGPNEGAMACGETGPGRMAEVDEILVAIAGFFRTDAPLSGRRALVTSGPTFEPIDPVRFIGNRSSGKQGHAVAAALARLGADTTLVSGPTALIDPLGVRVVHVETAAEMLAACTAALPVDVAVCAAAVADWRPAAPNDKKLKKERKNPPVIELAENPDILRTLSGAGNRRPNLVVGFAAETEEDATALVAAAAAKRVAKGCDWIVANDVSQARTFGADENAVHVVDGKGAESWPPLSKEVVGERLARRISDHFAVRP